MDRLHPGGCVAVIAGLSALCWGVLVELEFGVYVLLAVLLSA